MAYLNNSNRRVNKATYAPIQPDNNNPVDIEKRKKTLSVFEKIGFLRNLRLQKAEFAPLSNAINAVNDQAFKTALLSLLSIVMQEDFILGKPTSKKMTIQLKDVNADTLLAFGRLVKEMRDRIKSDFKRSFDSVKVAYENYLKQNQPPSPGPVISPAAIAASAALSTAPVSRISTLRDSVRFDITTIDVERKEEASSKPMDASGKKAAPALDGALKWAAVSNHQEFTSLVAMAQPYSSVKLASTEAVEFLKDLSTTVNDLPNYAGDAISNMEQRMSIEPIGRLHLERLQMTPESIERGELLYSLPLAPKETVRLSHREWATRSDEFEKIIQDSMENFSEEGVTEKNDISQSTTSQQAHSSALSLSASYSGYGFSASVGYNSTSDDSKVITDSRNNSVELTRKASSRVKQDHKVSFKVTSISGSEDETVREITNPSETQVMRVDYFGLMRKWRVELYRYGIRMTYDIVIPNPGSDLREKVEEISVLDKLIETPFEFDLPITAITESNWFNYAVKYRATIDAPPQGTIWLQQYKELPVKDRDESSRVDFDSLDFDVPDEYEIESGRVSANLTRWIGDSPGDPYFDVLKDEVGAGGGTYNSTLQHIVGKFGRLSVIFTWENSRTGLVEAMLKLRPKRTTFEKWRFKAWDNLRRSALENFLMEKQTYRDRRSKLAEEIKQFDALTLRQMEKEAIMKGVLKWIFGPGFDLMPSNILSLFNNSTTNNEDLIDPAGLSTDEWQRMLEYGEFIKFLHQAIEWENVLYFLYPYFWDSPQNWPSKQFLQHPDMIHRSFLRAGSARVVLTIRPGFEESFARLLLTGSFGELENNHPYISIAQEIRNYANTNYPGIPPANPADPASETTIENAERGVLIGSWFEYTPSSAIDISIDSNLNALA